jgi:hypothetical protein
VRFLPDASVGPFLAQQCPIRATRVRWGVVRGRDRRAPMSGMRRLCELWRQPHRCTPSDRRVLKGERPGELPVQQGTKLFSEMTNEASDFRLGEQSRLNAIVARTAAFDPDVWSGRAVQEADVAVNRFPRLGVPDRFAKLHQIGVLPSPLGQQSRGVAAELPIIRSCSIIHRSESHIGFADPPP